MKRIHLLLASVLLFAACTSKPATETAASSASPDYPYKIKNPDNWAIDTGHTNTMVALNALKSYETLDTVLMKKCFADSLIFKYDGGTFKGSIGQLIQMVGSMSTTMKNVKLDIKDWVAVVGKDSPKEEWVTIWYTQHWTNEKGKADSVEYINDMLLKGGKITRFDEYARHFKMPGK